MKSQLSRFALRGTILRAHRPRCQDDKADQQHTELYTSRQNLSPAPRPITLLPIEGLNTGELSRCRYSSENNK